MMVKRTIALVLLCAWCASGAGAAGPAAKQGSPLPTMSGRTNGERPAPALAPVAGGSPVGTVEPGLAEASAAYTPVDDAMLSEWIHPEPYSYRSGGLRDPFVSLISDDEDDATDPGVGDIFIVGILWGAQDRLALAQTRQGLCLILREGDRLRDGRVLSISPEGVTLVQYHFGLSRRIDLPIVSGEEVGNER